MTAAATSVHCAFYPKQDHGAGPGEIGFIDATGTHAKVRTPLEFVIAQGPTPSPTPTPTKKPVAPKAATDGCAKQIKN